MAKERRPEDELHNVDTREEGGGRRGRKGKVATCGWRAWRQGANGGRERQRVKASAAVLAGGGDESNGMERPAVRRSTGPEQPAVGGSGGGLGG